MVIAESSTALQALMLEQHEKKGGEYEDWAAVATQATSERDQASRDAVAAFEKSLKKALRWAFLMTVLDAGPPAGRDLQVSSPLSRRA